MAVRAADAAGAAPAIRVAPRAARPAPGRRKRPSHRSRTTAERPRAGPQRVARGRAAGRARSWHLCARLRARCRTPPGRAEGSAAPPDCGRTPRSDAPDGVIRPPERTHDGPRRVAGAVVHSPRCRGGSAQRAAMVTVAPAGIAPASRTATGGSAAVRSRTPARRGSPVRSRPPGRRGRRVRRGGRRRGRSRRRGRRGCRPRCRCRGRCGSRSGRGHRRGHGRGCRRRGRLVHRGAETAQVQPAEPGVVDSGRCCAVDRDAPCGGRGRRVGRAGIGRAGCGGGRIDRSAQPRLVERPEARVVGHIGGGDGAGLGGRHGRVDRGRRHLVDWSAQPRLVERSETRVVRGAGRNRLLSASGRGQRRRQRGAARHQGHDEQSSVHHVSLRRAGFVLGSVRIARP